MINKFLSILTVLFFISCSGKEENIIVIGSKKFTESVILGELAVQLANQGETIAVHKDQVGGTRVLWNALLKGEIDIYPEYTGTIIKEILSGKNISVSDSLAGILDEYGIGISEPLGFNNTYALGMKKENAAALGIEKISDLKNHPELKLGFTNEFMDRGDGYPSLKKAYNLPQSDVRGIDHDLAYQGIESGAIDVVDLYSTDAEIKYYDLKILKDDLNHFTEYKAVLLYRKDLKKDHPKILERILRLENNLTENEITKLNALVRIDKQTESIAAAGFLKDKFDLDIKVEEESVYSRFFRNTIDHLFLVGISLFAAILISIPLGIIAYKVSSFGNVILGIVGVIQTIPSLALLVFMIPFFGIGAKPAIIALFLYSLLPIVRNTHSGLQQISPQIRESADVLGLTRSAILRKIELPLISQSVLSGIKTSAVINVGTATLGALIGAGGYGQPILTGIRLDDMSLILQGAIPAAALAIAVQLFFDLSEKLLVPKGLRLRKE